MPREHMPVRPSKPKRVLRLIKTECPACYAVDSCERIRVTITLGNKLISDHLTGVNCSNCGAEEEAELTPQDEQILFSVGLSPRKHK